jgi:dTDP-4-amino-4,6-dideoxygalactose transaminase
MIGRFEAAVAAATGTRHAVAVNSGTAALHAAYHALGIGPGDEIVTSPITFAATGNAALYLGARPVFADVDSDTGLLDPAAAEAAMTPRTKALVAVDYTGTPASYDALADLATRRGVALVADAAHSLGGSYKGKPAGGQALVSILSFHPVKTITTGEGGAIVTDSDAIAGSASRFRTHGIERDQERLVDKTRPAWYHEMQELGYNYRLTDFQSALGLSQMAKLPRFLARRAEVARRYSEAFADLAGIETPVVPPDRVSAWHLYVIRTSDPALRDPLFEALRARGIGVQVHYIPVYMHPYYRGLGYAAGACPVAERFSASCISLPMFAGLSENDLDYTIETVRRAVAEVVGR